MSFIDEKIAEEVNKKKIGVHGTIEEGITINEELFTFHEEKLFDDIFSIMLPDSFIDMPEEMKNIKFPSLNRPQIIKCSKDGSINIGISKTNADINAEILPKTLNIVKQNIKNVNPANVFYDIKCESTDYITFGWFDFKTYAIDGQLYCMSALIIVEGKMYHTSLCTVFNNMNNWKQVMHEILLSMKDLTKLNRE